MHVKNFSILALLAPLFMVGCKSQSLLDPQGSNGSKASDAPLYMRMTDRDVALADAAVQQALESNQSMTPLAWENAGSDNSGEITPVRTYRNTTGHYCRTYRESLKVGGRSETYTDTACRGENGQWHPI